MDLQAGQKLTTMNTCIQNARETLMPTSIRLSSELEQRLSKLAKKTGRTKAFYLREIIEKGFEDVEDYYLALEVLNRNEKIYSSEEMRKELGLDD